MQAGQKPFAISECRAWGGVRLLRHHRSIISVLPSFVPSVHSESIPFRHFHSIRIPDRLRRDVVLGRVLSSTMTCVETARAGAFEGHRGREMSAIRWMFCASFDRRKASRRASAEPRGMRATIRPPSRRCSAALATCSIAVLPLPEGRVHHDRVVLVALVVILEGLVQKLRARRRKGRPRKQGSGRLDHRA